ncbi:MAG: acyltransferase family protein [Bacteriovoracaceae bacterium]
MRELPSKLDYLDGLRGLASLNVIFHHFFLAFAPLIASEGMGQYLINGPYAVEIFFTHSGFVLSYSFLKKKDRKILYSALLKRYLRLTIPLAFSVYFAYILLKAGWIQSVHYGELTHNSWFGAYYRFSPDLLEATKQAFYSTYTNFKSATTYNPVLWTIGIELTLSYALYISLLVFGVWKWRFFLYPLALFFSPPNSHAHAFLWGMILCELYISDWWQKIPKFFFWGTLPLGLILSTVTFLPFKSLGAALVIFSLMKSSKLESAFSWWPITWLGKWSFALYILHYPILSSLSVYLSSLPLWVNGLFTLGILLILSAIVYGLVDLQGIKISKWWAKLVLRKLLL